MSVNFKLLHPSGQVEGGFAVKWKIGNEKASILIIFK